MTMKRTPLAILAALICSTAPFASGQTSAKPASAASPSAQLDRFVGTGTCTGNEMAMGKNPGHATVGKFHGKKTLDGHWVAIHYDEDQTAANAKPFSVVQYFGYDATKKHFVTVLFTNTGDSYSTGVSTGWKGNAITFDETVWMDGKPASFRDVFTDGDSGMSSHTGLMKDKSGKWVKTDEETCHKA
jgi:hypothetical protein